MRSLKVWMVLGLVFIGLTKASLSESVSTIQNTEVTVPQYGLYEWNAPVTGKYKNPFDPDEVSLEAAFTSPDGQTTQVSGFFCQDYDEGAGPMDVSEKGGPQWRVRFCPTKAGTWNYRVTLRTKHGLEPYPPGSLKVIPSDSPGFIRNDSPNGLFFRFDDGKPYVPLGVAVCWTSRTSFFPDYLDYFEKIQAGRGNFTRVWFCEWNIPLEAMDLNSPMGHVLGLGRYSQDNAWRFDRLLGMAHDHGLKVLLTMDSYGQLMDEKGPWGEQAWSRNPYNKANGGPCGEPWDFFTNPKAQKLYRQKLRYIVARWGWDPDVFAFELWNEVKVPREWAAEMGAALRGMDPNRHLVTDSVGYPWNGKPYDEDKLWSLPEMGYTPLHYYGSGEGEGDLAETVYRRAWEMTKKIPKPFFFEELGLDGMTDDLKIDKTGRGTHLHNAFWASAVSPNAGVPLSHWKEYVDKFGLYKELAYVQPYLDSVDRGQDVWEPVEMNQTVADGTQGDLRIVPGANWDAPSGGEFRLTSDGQWNGNPSPYLKTTARDGNQAPKWIVDAPKGCRLVLGVNRVSIGADLRVLVDGKEAWRKVFDASPAPGGDGEYQSTKLDPQWNIYQADYHKEYPVDLPEGKHEIQLVNSGQDWINLESLTFTHFLKGSRIKLYGMKSEGTVLAWIQDKKDVWGRMYKESAVEPPVRKGLAFTLPGLTNGTYKIQWWDTYRGKVLSEDVGTVKSGTLTLKAPPFKKDIAVILYRNRYTENISPPRTPSPPSRTDD